MCDICTFNKDLVIKLSYDVVLDAILNSLHWTIHFKVVMKYGWTKTKLETKLNQIAKHFVEGN